MATPTEPNTSNPPDNLSNIFPIKIVLPGVVVLSILFLIVFMIYIPDQNRVSDNLSNIFPIKIVLPGIVVLSIIFLIVLMIYIRVRNQNDPISSSRVALDTAILSALPITVFSSTESECAICLTELTDGELGRFLPQCNHGFHLSCIDEWFLISSACPICRSPVDPPQKIPASNYSTKSVTLVMEAANTDIKEGTLQPTESSTAAEVESSALEHRTEEIKSPAMESLGWLRRFVSSSCSSRGRDVEQGQGGVGGGRN